MRKITQQAVNAFYAGVNFTSSNTDIIRHDRNKVEMSLFGNCIASLDLKTKIVTITNAGWKSNTTKERLNALNGVSISQKKGEWYLNGKKWDGKPIEII